MGRIILTTCGTSLYASCSWTLNCINVSNEEFKRLSEYDLTDRSQRKEFRRRQRELEGVIEDLESSWKELADSFDKTAWMKDRLRDLPAELASLRVIQHYCEKIDRPLNVEDKLVLCYADNARASFCVNVLERAIKNVLIEQNHLKLQLDESIKVIGLNPLGDPSSYIKSFEWIWEKIASDYGPEEGISYYFNLTGGYKPLVMVLACFAYIKALNKDTTIFSLNEESGDDILVITFEADEGHIGGLALPLKTGRISGEGTGTDVVIMDMGMPL